MVNLPMFEAPSNKHETWKMASDSNETTLLYFNISMESVYRQIYLKESIQHDHVEWLC